ncbi:103L [Cherax quadricarinatus iridovirus]|uniref:Papainase n=1 Tax=Shrimp hemocyte iridescent virus TaxID=2039780 RepID=A0A291B0P8_9VIRU|nr:103L [Cherax quadricarinatus iridovirus]YP_010084803.1 papainase [Shrimp hemocyte iridescent virus]UPA43413.1 papainase [Iridovirus CN01]ASZ85083.1 103L [Cherax quadricarinatus iridovirus]ATE87060.1 papainase [Shrimp hemocyte iridescent virus]UPA43489.1 papainase [Iridovirus CN01]UPA43685.1 papainase [Iridovirus CN01]
MEQYLKSRRSTILHKNEGKDIDIAIENERQKNLFGNISENFKQDNKNDLIIPPLNTDIRFSEILPTHKPTYDERHGLFMSHPVIGQTDEHDHDTDSDSDDEDEQQFMMRTARRNLKEHPQTLHEHEDILENFTWGGSSEHDTSDDKMKKTLISKVRAQHACGSCWAVSIADCMSDCLVVSGTVNWSPNISETYLMAKIPQKNIHSLCFGGNPAGAVRYLEKNFIADSSCVDYSWCSGDDQNCTSVSSSKHFDVKQLTEILNANIPIPNGCYFSDKKKYMYKLNPGSDMFYKKDRMPLEKFRNTVKSHIVDFGPTIGGFVVLANFSTGNFTDPNINGGIYFDRADYNGYSGSGPLRFSDEMTSDVSGLHAVCIVGWGIKNNIQFDNDKFGDVPYWHCRNSWGTNWGNEGGYFKIAMYPFNKISQFDKQVMTEMGGPVGSMILIRATEPPKAIDASEIPKTFQNKINRQLSNEYYMASPERVRQINGSTGKFPLVAFGNGTYEQTRVLMLLVFILVLILLVRVFMKK